MTYSKIDILEDNYDQPRVLGYRVSGVWNTINAHHLDSLGP